MDAPTPGINRDNSAASQKEVVGHDGGQNDIETTILALYSLFNLSAIFWEMYDHAQGFPYYVNVHTNERSFSWLLLHFM